MQEGFRNFPQPLFTKEGRKRNEEKSKDWKFQNEECKIWVFQFKRIDFF